MGKAGLRGRVETLKCRQAVTRGRGVDGIWLRGAGAGGAGKHIHHLLVQRALIWLQRRHVGKDGIRKGGSRNVRQKGVRQNKTQPFRVEEEEGLILDHWAAHRSRPLVCVRAGLWSTSVVEHPVVGVHGRTIPPVQRVPVEIIGSGLGQRDDLGASQLVKLRRVWVGDDRCFLDLVGANRNVGRTGVIDIEVRVHVIFAIDREQVGGRRHAIHSEVSVTGGVVHLYPRRCLCDVRDIAASAWQQGYFLLREGGADAGTGRIDNRYGARNFDSDALGRYRQRYVPCRRLTHKNGGRNLHFSKATLVHCDLIIPRFQQRKPIEAAVVGRDRLQRARVQALQHNGCIGHHGVGGIRNGPRNIAGCERLPHGRRRLEADYQQKGDERALKTVSHLHSSKENL